MDPIKQQIAMAEYRGFTKIHKFNKWQEGGPSSTKDGDLVGDLGRVTKRHLPDYGKDLNAMMDVVWSLPETLHSRYAITLEFVTGGRTNDPHNAGFNPFKCHTANAAQHLEATLKTLDLWTEE